MRVPDPEDPKYWREYSDRWQYFDMGLYKSDFVSGKLNCDNSTGRKYRKLCFRELLLNIIISMGM